jgi:hypothetical protein
VCKNCNIVPAIGQVDVVVYEQASDVTVKTSNVFRFFSPSKKTPFHIILPIASQMHFEYKNTVALGRCSVFARCHVKTSAFWK